mgnify:CR=1 FL=1
MAFDLDQFRQAISQSPAVARVFERDKMTSTFTSEEKAIVYQLKRSLKLAMEDGGISDYSNFNMVIAGGFFASMFGSTAYNQYNDLDVFILNGNDGLFQNCIQTTTYKWKVNNNIGRLASYFQNPHIIATAKNDKNKVQYISGRVELCGTEG